MNATAENTTTVPTQEITEQNGNFAESVEISETAAHMQGVNTYATRNTTSANLDQNIRDIALDISNGVRDSNDARWEIAGLLVAAKIPEYVARRSPNLSSQQREDLAWELENFLYEKARDANAMDITYFIDGSSPSAWARKMCQVATQSKLRDLNRIPSREQAVDPTVSANTDPGEQNFDFASLKFARASVTDDFDWERNNELEEVEDDFASAVSGLRPEGRTRLSARSLRAAYHVGEPIRPLHPVDRNAIRSALMDSPDLARSSVRAMLALTAGKETPDTRRVADEYLALWDSYTTTEMTTLATAPPAVAHTIAIVAVSQIQRPSRDELALALRTIRMADSGRDWRNLSKALFESWVAREAETTSEFNHKHEETEDDVKARNKAAAKTAATWPALVAAVIALPGSPLGADERTVSDFIGSVVEALRS